MNESQSDTSEGGFPWGLLFAVVALAAVVTIALPAFLKSRPTASRDSVINSLRIIEGAKDQWALEHGKKPGDLPAVSDLTPYLKYNTLPARIVGETLHINAIGIPASAVVPVPYGRVPAGGTVTFEK